MDRYTDRDCLAAILIAAQHLGFAVVLPKSTYRESLVELAEGLGVPVADYVDEVDRLFLDHAPGAFGGGVRPMLMRANCTGHSTPRWWIPSAGLGPGAVPRKQFCHILRAVAYALEEAAQEVTQ